MGQALELDRRLASLRSLAKDSPELTKIVKELETGASKVRELQVCRRLERSPKCCDFESVVGVGAGAAGKMNSRSIPI